MTANQAFRKKFKGQPNIMTPHIDSRGTTKRFYWELSSGQGFSNEGTIWGVTVFNLDGTPMDDASKMYRSKQAALDAITELG